MNYREKYLKRAKRAATYLRWCPFLRLAGLNGSIVRGEQSQKSDIDFLIIAKAGRLYTARFFATFLVALTGYRRHGKKIAGRICLNCYLNDKNPDISPKNPSSNEKVASAYKYLIPLTDENVAAERFFQINTWMNKFTVSGKTYSTNLQKKLSPNGPGKPKRFLENILSGSFGDWIEKRLMSYQVKRINRGFEKFDETLATEEEIRLHPKKV